MKTLYPLNKYTLAITPRTALNDYQHQYTGYNSGRYPQNALYSVVPSNDKLKPYEFVSCITSGYIPQRYRNQLSEKGLKDLATLIDIHIMANKCKKVLLVNLDDANGYLGIDLARHLIRCTSIDIINATANPIGVPACSFGNLAFQSLPDLSCYDTVIFLDDVHLTMKKPHNAFEVLYQKGLKVSLIIAASFTDFRKRTTVANHLDFKMKEVAVSLNFNRCEIIKTTQLNEVENAPVIQSSTPIQCVKQNITIEREPMDSISLMLDLARKRVETDEHCEEDLKMLRYAVSNNKLLLIALDENWVLTEHLASSLSWLGKNDVWIAAATQRDLVAEVHPNAVITRKQSFVLNQQVRHLYNTDPTEFDFIVIVAANDYLAGGKTPESIMQALGFENAKNVIFLNHCQLKNA